MKIYQYLRCGFQVVAVVLYVLVPLAGCTSPGDVSPARYLLKSPFWMERPAHWNDPLQETDAIRADLNRIKARCQDMEDIQRHQGRCVIEEGRASFQITFDDRDFRKNVTLHVYPVDVPGAEQMAPFWVVVDKKSYCEHRWFYGGLCLVTEDQMWKIIKDLYRLQQR